MKPNGITNVGAGLRDGDEAKVGCAASQAHQLTVVR